MNEKGPYRGNKIKKEKNN